MRAADRLKVNLLYAGNFIFVSLSPAPFAAILVYTYNLIRPGFAFSGTDWAIYIVSIALMGLIGWFLKWSGKQRQRIRARDADAVSESDVTGIRRKKH